MTEVVRPRGIETSQRNPTWIASARIVGAIPSGNSCRAVIQAWGYFCRNELVRSNIS